MQEGSLCGRQSVDHPQRHRLTNKVSGLSHEIITISVIITNNLDLQMSPKLQRLEWYPITRCIGAIWGSITLMTWECCKNDFMSIGNISHTLLITLTSIVNVIHLWHLLLCIPKLVLEGQILPQLSHGIDIPSKWLDSTWFFKWVNVPSLPHTLQMDDLACIGVPFLFFPPTGIIFSLFSIIDFTLSSSACRSVPGWFGIATAAEDLIGALLFWGRSLLKGVGSGDFSCSSSNSLEFCPVTPFSLISSAMARKESKSSC